MHYYVDAYKTQSKNNETYFNTLILSAPMSLELSEFDIANIIKKYKSEIC